jgi:hypothetical protein
MASVLAITLLDIAAWGWAGVCGALLFAGDGKSQGPAIQDL